MAGLYVILFFCIMVMIVCIRFLVQQKSQSKAFLKELDELEKTEKLEKATGKKSEEFPVRIMVDQVPALSNGNILGEQVTVKRQSTGYILARINAGGSADFKITEKTTVSVNSSAIGSIPCTTTLEPFGIYKASWGMGLAAARIASCSKIGSLKQPEKTEPLSNADEIRKYKELLDSGIISEEEFNQKKKQLLGL